MNRITLNLASRPFRNNTIVGSVLAGAVAALIAATVYNGYVFLNYGGHYRHLQGEERQHRERLAALETEERDLSRKIASRDFRHLYGRGVFAGNLILKRSFSWTLLFNRLEDLVPPEVMMTAVRPNISGEKTVIRVDGVARNHGGLLALEESLQKNPVFARVHPIYERRVNPSRPEIDFALEFDYFPTPNPPGPDAIASGGGPAAAPSPAAVAPTPTPATIASAPTPGPSPEPGRPSAAPREGAAQAAGPAATPRQVIGTVGRDGRPRTPELLARVIAAPGGVYPATPPEPPTDAPSRKSGGKPRDRAQSPGRDSTHIAPTQEGAPVVSREGAAPAPPGTGGATEAATQPSAPPGADSRTASPATWQDGAAVTPGSGRPGALSRGRIPMPGAGRSSVRMNRGSGPRPAPTVPATRLDVPLKFSSRPVGDVYAALSTAHAVRIEIDPTVDKKAKVTADLSGKSLAEAFASLSKLTGHKVLRIEDGLYRVVTLAGGEPLGERSVQEEPLPGSEVKP